MSRARQRRLSYSSATCFHRAVKFCPCTIGQSQAIKWLTKRALGTKTLGRPQSSLRDIRCARQHDDGRLRLEPSHFNCKLLPIHLGHGQAFGTDGSAICTLGMLHVVKDGQVLEQQGGPFEG